MPPNETQKHKGEGINEPLTSTMWCLWIIHGHQHCDYSGLIFLLCLHYFCQERDGKLDMEVIMWFRTNFPYNLYCKPLWYSNGVGTAQNQKRKTVQLQVANECVPKMLLLTSAMGVWKHTSDIFCNQMVRWVPMPKISWSSDIFRSFIQLSPTSIITVEN